MGKGVTMPVCGICKNEFPGWVVIEGKKRNLNSRKYCLGCSPRGGHNTRQLDAPVGSKTPDSGHYRCNMCKQTLPTSLFYMQKGKPKSPCKECRKNRYETLTPIKQRLVGYKGGKCAVCGYGKYIGALVFHHRDPTKKDFPVGGNCSLSLKKLIPEVDKCVLLCINCHREVHAGFTELPIETKP